MKSRIGGAGEIRTRDQRIKSPLLYRLSYRSTEKNKFGVPKGIRTPVTAVKGRCPRPLDDRDSSFNYLA